MKKEKICIGTWEKEFFNRLSEKLEELFPKTNQDNPEIPSKGNRTTALVFNAEANLIFRDILKKVLISQRQEYHKEFSDWFYSKGNWAGDAPIEDVIEIILNPKK